jgi:hypothetical protein
MAFLFFLAHCLPRRQNPLACFLSGPFLYLANLHTLFSADMGTFCAAASVFGAATDPWPTVKALCDDLVAAGFDDVTPEVVAASAGWRLASAHLAVDRPVITWAHVDAAQQTHDESQDASVSEASDSEAESDDDMPTTKPPGAAAEPPSAKKTRGNSAAPDGFFFFFFLPSCAPGFFNPNHEQLLAMDKGNKNCGPGRK